MNPIDFHKDLNSEQAAAALAPDGPVLVIAAAGTGKTRTLTYRVAHLVERGVDPHRILLLTFTNRAAREMMDRARLLVGEAVGGVWGGTFHHLANRLLRRHAPLIGFRSDFAILDDDDSKGELRRCTAEQGFKDKHFPKPEVLSSVIGLANSRAAPLAGVMETDFPDLAKYADGIAAVAQAYTKRKLELGAMDFDDLLIMTLRLFREHPGVLGVYQDRFLHVLVDEYQDTNTLQAEMVDLLVHRNRNILVVGDDFQSIYSWRGANFRNFLSFPDRYADTVTFKLETNYRSLPGILEVANACIAGNPEQFQKTLRPVRKSPVKPVRVTLRTGEEQGRFLVEKIHDLRRQGCALRDIAVLYRSHYQAMEAQLALTQNNIPFSITSGVRFFEQAHIKDVCALLRLVYNPLDELGFLRLMGLLPRVGDRTARKLWADIGRRFQPMAAESSLALEKKLPKDAAGDWRKIRKAIEHLPPGDAQRSGGEIASAFLDAFYKEFVTLNFENGTRRVEDVQELVNFIARFETVGDFLNEVALMTNLDTGSMRDEDRKADGVLLSTVHQAKGLEWKVVFVLWLSEGQFPASRAMTNPEGESEERRLFYVAVTRAKDELYLCSPQRRITKDRGIMFFAPSRFLRELPARLLNNAQFEAFY